MVNSPSTEYQNVDHLGNHRFLGSVALPNDCVDSDALSISEAMDSEKLEHVIEKDYFYSGTISTATKFLSLILSNYSDIVAVEASIQTTVPTSTATVTIDLQMASDGGTYATVLTTVITLDATSVLRTLQAAVINASAGQNLSGKKQLKLVFTTGGSGTQAADVLVTVRTKQRSV